MWFLSTLLCLTPTECDLAWWRRLQSSVQSDSQIWPTHVLLSPPLCPPGQSRPQRLHDIIELFSFSCRTPSMLTGHGQDLLLTSQVTSNNLQHIRNRLAFLQLSILRLVEVVEVATHWCWEVHCAQSTSPSSPRRRRRRSSARL